MTGDLDSDARTSIVPSLGAGTLLTMERLFAVAMGRGGLRAQPAAASLLDRLAPSVNVRHLARGAEVDPAEDEKFTKALGKARGRIDGAVAAAMAIGRITAGEAGASPYETMRPEGSPVL